MKQTPPPHQDTSFIMPEKMHDENINYHTTPKSGSGFDVVKSIRGRIRTLRNFLNEQKRETDSHFKIE